MPKYKVSWTEELWYEATIEADSEDEAKEMIFRADFKWPKPYDSELQDLVEAVEVNG